MEIDAIRSAVGPEEEGIPVFVSTGGTVVRQPRINMSMALTTVSAADGQTIVLGGMIQKDTVTAHRRVPYLSDVPVLGNIFRYDLSATVRRELLIIMTPHVVYNEEDADRIKKVEAARMQWCLADVVDMYGDFGIRRRRDEWSDADVPTIYPDLKPTVERVPTPVPAEKRQEAAPPVPQPVAPTAPSIGTPPAVPPAGTPPPAPGLAPKAKLLQPGGGALRAPWPPTDRNRPQAEPQAANEGGPPTLVEPATWVDPQGPPAAVPSYSPPASANPLRGY